MDVLSSRLRDHQLRSTLPASGHAYLLARQAMARIIVQSASSPNDGSTGVPACTVIICRSLCSYRLGLILGLPGGITPSIYPLAGSASDRVKYQGQVTG